MKNTNFKFRTWVLVLDKMTFLVPENLIDNNTPDVSKFLALATIKKTNTNEYTYSIFGNSDYLTGYNNGKVNIGTEASMIAAMGTVESELSPFII